jgi:TonB-linked SusC/RagA family outer membrane protein
VSFYVGYKTTNIKIGERANYAVLMNVAVDDLDKVQIQAYGKTNRRLATGNIATVTAEEIEKQPVMNPLQALQGRVPGLVVTQTSGYASAPFKVELRGRNNINDLLTSDPLYIVDGVPLTVSEVGNNSTYNSGSSGFWQNKVVPPARGQSPFFSINPDDIESIEVLKDADATAIYGSRGANGVLLITTKRGKAGKTKVDGSISQGIKTITRHWEMLNTQQYIEMRKEAFKNDNISMSNLNAFDLLVWDSTRYTDWQKYLWENNGRTTDAQAGISGGNNQITFRLGSGYTRTTDITTSNGADERFSLALNLGYKSINQRFGLAISNIYSYAKSDMIFLPSNSLLPPNAPPVSDNNGKPNYTGWQPADYPFASLYQPYTSQTNFLNSNLTLNYEVIKGLNLRSSFGYNSAYAKQTRFTPISSLNPAFSPKGTAQFGNNNIGNWVVEPQLDYNRIIGGGKLSLLFGSTIQSNSTVGQSTEGNGYTSDLLLRSISNAPSKDANEFNGEYKYAALFGRLTYNWLNKYLLNLSARRDGSSRFGQDKLFGNFGAIGAAWIFSEESFTKRNLKFLSYGKIRTSYGTTGSDAIGDYKYLTRWSSTGYYPYGGVSSLVPMQHANSQYHWPTNKKLEAALDLGLFKDKILFSMAWYRNRCNDQLINFPLATYTGFNSVVANSPANVQNIGMEFTLSGTIIKIKDFQWELNINTSVNKNTLLSYPDLENSPFPNQYIIGKSLNFIRLLHYTGVDPQTGLYTVEDKNKDGAINTYFGPTDDRYIIELKPKFGGLGSNFTYRGMELSLFFQIVKQKGLNALMNIGTTPGGMYNTSAYVFDNRWQKPGDVVPVAKFTTQPDNSYANFYNSDGVYTDASYIRLTNLAVSYSLPATLTKKLGMQSVRFRIVAQNVLTLSNYKGIDPETQNFGGMPPSKIVNGGLTFNF